jgi:polyphenol oxidase
MHNEWLQPGEMPHNVRAVMTTRAGGVSLLPFDSMNVGARVGDDAAAVGHNRLLLAQALGCEAVYLHQVHGTRVVRLTRADADQTAKLGADPSLRAQDGQEADACFTTDVGVACTVQVADCLPVLFASRLGTVVGAAHAGWRGLAGGVLENTVQAMCNATNTSPQDLIAWMGPCIGPAHFEVGADVLDAFPKQRMHFKDAPRADGAMRWLADLPALARARLRSAGLTSTLGGDGCTVADATRFFSYRRDGVTGRHVAVVYLTSSPDGRGV